MSTRRRKLQLKVHSVLYEVGLVYEHHMSRLRSCCSVQITPQVELKANMFYFLKSAACIILQVDFVIASFFYEDLISESSADIKFSQYSILCSIL
jgi:hypothetical protein